MSVIFYVFAIVMELICRELCNSQPSLSQRVNVNHVLISCELRLKYY